MKDKMLIDDRGDISFLNSLFRESHRQSRVKRLAIRPQASSVERQLCKTKCFRMVLGASTQNAPSTRLTRQAFQLFRMQFVQQLKLLKSCAVE